MHRAHQRDESLIRTDVRGRAMSPNVLLARRKCECVSQFSVFIDGLPDDSPRHLAKVFPPTSIEAVDRTSSGRPDAEGLTLTNYDISAPITRRLNDSERNCIDADNQCSTLTDDLLEAQQTLIQFSESIRLLDIDSASSRSSRRRLQIDSAIPAMSQHAQFDPTTLSIILDYREPVRRHEL